MTIGGRMKASKIIYWIAVLSLGFYVLKSVVPYRTGASVSDLLAMGIWIFLWWMLFRRPRAWGLGIGIFLFVTIAAQIGLWRLALTSPKKEALGISDSWIIFSVKSLPLLISGISSISLRWLLREEPIQSATENSGADR
jgi:hypothetical protein